MGGERVDGRRKLPPPALTLALAVVAMVAYAATEQPGGPIFLASFLGAANLALFTPACVWLRSTAVAGVIHWLRARAEIRTSATEENLHEHPLALDAQGACSVRCRLRGASGIRSCRLRTRRLTALGATSTLSRLDPVDVGNGSSALEAPCETVMRR